MINRVAVAFGLVILLITATYFLSDSGKISQSDSYEYEGDTVHTIYSTTQGAGRERSSQKAPNRSERPRSTRRPSRNWICFALQDSVPVFDRDDHIISYISPGTFYKVLEDSSYWLKIELDSTLTGYIHRDKVRFSKANKPHIEQLLDAWSTTTSDLYEKLIDQFPDTMMVKQRSDWGPRPDEPLAFIKLVYKTRVLEKQSKWRELIDTWDTIVDKYPDKLVNYLPAGVISKFEKADLFHRLNMPDSVLSMYVSIIMEDHDIEYNSPDLEGHYYADRRAFNEYINYALGLDLPEDELANRLNWLYSGSSDFVQILIKLQLNKIYFNSEEYEKALTNYLTILQGPRLTWYSFKTYGELRHAALYQLRNLGVQHVNAEYALSTLDTAQSQTTDQDLIWLTNYLKGMCYLEFGDTINARESFAYCLSNPFQKQGSEISLSILPYSHKPALSKRRATETINELIAP